MSRAVSVVIPLLNEEPTLVELHRQLREVEREQGYELQIVFVDDGSKDGSWETVTKLANEHPLTEGVRFRRNFGKAAALMAGFESATAPIVVTMDADLQDDPRELPKLIGRLDGEGDLPECDVVSGWKTDRQDPWHKRWPSLCFNTLVSRLTGVQLHDHNCGLKAYRREALDEVRLYGELHRFVPVLAASRGYRVAEVSVHHRAREHGVSKYGASRILKGLLDLITVKFLTGYGERPQHALGAVGLLSFLAGAAGLSYLATRWVISRTAPGLEPLHLHDTAALYYSLAFCLVGSQFLSVSLLGAMISSLVSRDSVSYSVAEYTAAAPTATAAERATPREAS